MTIVGHERNIALLKKLLEREHPVHAFLFSGPEKVGKKLVATAFADGILCRKREFGGCGSCVVCIERYRMGKARDLLLIKPEDGVITIDSARGVVKFLSKTPGVSTRKTVIVDDADRLTDDAQNALLKTAEESPHDSTLIFVTSRPGRLFETLRSRMVTIRFQSVPDDRLAKAPGIEKLDAKSRSKITLLAVGRPGKAVELANDKARISSEIKLAERVERVTSASIPDKMLFARDIYEKTDLKDMFAFLLSRFHKDLHATNEPKGLARAAYNARLVMTAGFLAEDTNTNERLLLEQALLSMK